MRYAALLKGVNVGGNRKLPMADLKAFVEGLGFGAVQTLLASGNVVFEADADAAALEALLADQAKGALGLDTAWFVRSHAELAAVLAADPFPNAARARPNHLLVTFHREAFPAPLLDELATRYDGCERLACIGRELFVDYDEGIGQSKLPQATGKLKFPTLGTARNWNTVGKLVALTA
jgi:uncharacterized protein (DUF1697 family)